MVREVVTRNDGITVDIPKEQAGSLPQMTQKLENYSSGQAKYVGEAAPGTATSEARWRIKQLEYDDGISKPPTGIVWADGTADFTKEWDERANYTYS